jgi:outer membrane protein assembly factor BamB
MSGHALAYRVLAAMVALVTLPAATAQATRHSGVVDWPEYGFDAANTTHNPLETVLDPSNVGSLRRIWFTRLADTVSSAPALVDGVLYVCAQAHLHALDAATGGELWQVDVPGWSGCRDPAVHDGRVFVNDSSERLYAFDASTGAELWVTSLDGSATPAAPTIADGVVYVGSSNGGLYAIEEATGVIRWTAQTPDVIFGSAAIGDGRVFVESEDRRLYAFDVTTGALLWRIDVRGGSSSAPLYADGVVYAPGWHGERITALDASTGAVLWSRHVCHPNTPSLAGGVLLVPMGCTHSAVIALDAATGARIWRTDLPDIVETPSAPVVANGVVYVTSGGNLSILDASNGQKLNVIKLGEGQLPPPDPIVANGMVFVGSTYSRDGFYGIGL